MYRKRIDDEQIRNKCDAYDYVHGRCTMYANCNMRSYRIQICNFKMKQRCNKGSRWNMCLARLEKPPNPRLQTRQLVLITVLSLLPSTVWNGCCKTLEEYMSMVSCIECRSHLPQLFHQYCVLVTNKSVNWILCRDVEEVQRHILHERKGRKYEIQSIVSLTSAKHQQAFPAEPLRLRWEWVCQAPCSENRRPPWRNLNLHAGE